MTRRAHGVVRNNTVVIDEDLREMEGRRVEVELRDEAPLRGSDDADLGSAWAEWAAAGEQGPIRDETAPGMRQ